MDNIRRINRKLTDEEKARHRQIVEQIDRERPQLDAQALAKKAELETLRAAFRQLKQQRERKGVSLSEVALRSGIEELRLAEMEREPYPVLNWEVLFRVARAIGVELTMGVTAA